MTPRSAQLCQSLLQLLWFPFCCVFIGQRGSASRRLRSRFSPLSARFFLADSSSPPAGRELGSCDVVTVLIIFILTLLFFRVWLDIYCEAPCIPHGSDRCVGGPDDDRRIRILFLSHHGSHFQFVVCIETDCCLPRAASVQAHGLASPFPI